MKKLAFIYLALFLLLPLQSCEKEDSQEDCKCPIKGTIYTSSDEGKNWYYAGLDGWTGFYFPCEFDNTETNQSYGPDRGKKQFGLV